MFEEMTVGTSISSCGCCTSVVALATCPSKELSAAASEVVGEALETDDP